jgi:glycogen debranching enzyme
MRTQDIIKVKDQFYVRARSALADDRQRVLVDGDSFAIFDRLGDFQPVGLGEFGLFHRGTRHLSGFVMRLGGIQPLLLSSTLRDDNAVLAVDVTNPDYKVRGEEVLRGTVHIYRSKFLSANTCFERIRVGNYGLEKMDFILVFQCSADFVDIFEVRGFHRTARGTILEPKAGPKSLELSYVGLDQTVRTTTIHVIGVDADITTKSIRIPIKLSAGQETEFFLSIVCTPGESRGQRTYQGARQALEHSIDPGDGVGCKVFTSNEQFNDWVNRSRADLRMLTAKTDFGPYPYAGVPWFSSPFGRDGIITALQDLWLNPGLAAGVLKFLAATQSDTTDPERDAEPGKIVHEIRKGEMAILKEIPFRQYYGSIDSTPLFLVLASAYFKRTNDLDLMRSLWPHFERALRWIDEYGDRDRDGFIEYSTGSKHGLVQQGWKDSQDSVFMENGALAEGPIALCEVQGYVYAAKRGLADIAVHLGKPELADLLQEQAERLKAQFQQAFWCEGIGVYALALDGQKRPCRIRSSNAAQCLFTGITEEEHAQRIIIECGRDDFYNGWGIRTIASDQPRFNPMSYHNGSIWPHDNALIAYGLASRSDKHLACRILTGLFDASIAIELHRLPELFCGFARRPKKAPTLYPVACSPQAWAAGSVFMLLQACLGLSISAAEKRVYFQYPSLPESIPQIRLTGLDVGGATLDLDISRGRKAVSIGISGREGAVEVVEVH